MAHRKVKGVDWFVHTLVADDGLKLGTFVEGRFKLGPARVLRGAYGQVIVVSDRVPIAFDHGTGTYMGGWSQFLDASDPIHTFKWGCF